MRCTICKRPIVAGPEARSMIVEYAHPDGTTDLYGHQMPAGPVSAATGRLRRAWHRRCYHVTRKRDARGDPVAGRVLAGGPTGYDITTTDTTTVAATADQLRELAAAMGKGVGDPTVAEAWRAQCAGGPYTHSHDAAMPMSDYQLLAHLIHAHGHTYANEVADFVLLHDRLHQVGDAATAVAAARAADPAHIDEMITTVDWRDHLVVDVDTLAKE